MSNLYLVISILIKPEGISNFNQADWNLFLRQAYQANILGRLYYLFKIHNLLDEVPSNTRWHFESAYKVFMAHKKDIEIEIGYINQSLKITGLQPTFLKGAAYILAGDKVSEGRLFSDVDIFIPKDKLPSAEKSFQWGGWRFGKLDDYDKEYYRKWMHELPPLVHTSRGITLDVHHNLLPLTSRLSLDAKNLQSSVDSKMQTLSPSGRVIHSIVHLFMESEFDKGVRDLSDLDILLREHSRQDNSFWRNLINKAEELGVGRLLFYALRYTNKIYLTPVPSDIQKEVEQSYSPNRFILRIIDWMFLQALTCPPTYSNSLRNIVSHFSLFIRGHWLRMPLKLLVPHLLHKAFITPFKKHDTNE